MGWACFVHLNHLRPSPLASSNVKGQPCGSPASYPTRLRIVIARQVRKDQRKSKGTRAFLFPHHLHFISSQRKWSPPIELHKTVAGRKQGSYELPALVSRRLRLRPAVWLRFWPLHARSACRFRCWLPSPPHLFEDWWLVRVRSMASTTFIGNTRAHHGFVRPSTSSSWHLSRLHAICL